MNEQSPFLNKSVCDLFPGPGDDVIDAMDQGRQRQLRLQEIAKISGVSVERILEITSCGPGNDEQDRCRRRLLQTSRVRYAHRLGWPD